MAKKELTVVMRARNAMAAGLAKAQRSLQKFGQSAKRIGGLFAKAFLGAGAALVAFSTKAITAYAKQEKAERALASAMSASGENGEALLPTLKKIAAAIQDETGAADENTLATMAQLKTLGVQTTKLGEAARATIALKSVGLEGASAQRAVALAMQGNYEMLNRYIPAIRNATSEEEKAAAFQALVTKGYKQQEDQLNTVAGRWNELKGRIGDAMEQVGQAITENSGLIDILAKVSEKVKELAGRFQDFAENGGLQSSIMTAKLFGIEFVSSLKSIGEYAKGFYNIVNASLIEPVKRYYDMIMNAVVPAGMAFGKLLKGEFAEAGRMAKEAVDNAKNSVKGLFDSDNYKSYFKGVTDAWDDTGKAIEKIEQDKANKIDAINKKYVADEKARREKQAADEKNAESGKNDLIGKGVDELREKRKQSVIDATKAAKRAALEATKADLDSIAERKRAAEDLARTRVQALIDERRQQKRISKDMADEDKRARGLMAKESTGRIKLSKGDREFLDAWKTINRAKDEAGALGRSEAAKAGEVKKYEDQLKRLDTIAEKLQDIKDQNNELLRMG